MGILKTATILKGWTDHIIQTWPSQYLLQFMNSIVRCFNIGLGRNPLETAEEANESNCPYFETLKSIIFKLTLNDSIAYINLFTDYFIKLGRSAII